MPALPDAPASGPLADLAVVVLAYGHEHFGALVARLLEEGLEPAQLIVVHNPRRPGEADLEPPAPVRVLRMAENRGYAAAMNAGLRAARADGVARTLLLTHDVGIASGAVLRLAEAARARDVPGITGPRLRWLTPAGEVDREQYGGWWSAGGRSGQYRGHPGPLVREAPALSACDHLDGAALLVDAAVLDAVGGLDERYFLYFEETDWCLRAGAAGLPSRCAVDAVFTQAPGAASRPGAFAFLYFRNHLEVVRRHGGRRAAVGALAADVRLLPVRRLVRPGPSDVRRAARAWTIGQGLGVLAFALRRFGPPPAWLPGMGDVAVARRRRRRGPLPLLLLALLAVLSLGGCGRGDAGGGHPADAGAPLLGPASAAGRGCVDAPATVGARARASQRRLGLVVGLDAGLRYELREGRPGSPCAVADLLQSIGVGSVREVFTWEQLEPRQAVFDWRATDRLVTLAARRGLVVLPVLLGRPAWSAPDMDAAYGRYVGEVARRYGPDGTFWRSPGAPDGPPMETFELWNEPYVAANPERLTPAAYARRVRVGVTVARGLAPRARFLIAGETSYTSATDGQLHASWLDDVLDADPGLGRFFDGVAVHPYGAAPAPFDPADTRTNQPGRLEQVHAELVARGLGDKPLWVTEIGWPTCRDARVCVSPATQASDLRAFFGLARTRWRAYVRAVFVYQLRESGQPGSNPDDPYGAFGILDGTFRPKPAFDVVRAAAAGG